MMSAQEGRNLPSPPTDKCDKTTLWVGNINFRTTDYVLLQLLKKYGALKKFDLPYHKAGPNKGQHRGFCFVSYQRKADAERVIRCLNNKPVMGKYLSVSWATSQPQYDNPMKKVDTAKRPCEVDRRADLSNDAKIRMIERKLRRMKDTKSHPDFDVTTEFPPSSKYQRTGQSESSASSQHSTKLENKTTLR